MFPRIRLVGSDENEIGLDPALDRDDDFERRIAPQHEKRLCFRGRRVVQHRRRLADGAILRRGSEARQREHAPRGNGQRNATRHLCVDPR